MLRNRFGCNVVRNVKPECLGILVLTIDSCFDLGTYCGCITTAVSTGFGDSSNVGVTTYHPQLVVSPLPLRLLETFVLPHFRLTSTFLLHQVPALYRFYLYAKSLRST